MLPLRIISAGNIAGCIEEELFFLFLLQFLCDTCVSNLCLLKTIGIWCSMYDKYRCLASLPGAGSDPVDDTPSDIQTLGGDEGLKAMEKAGFTNVKTSQVAIPLFVPPNFGLRDLFFFMINPTPMNVRKCNCRKFDIILSQQHILSSENAATCWAR